MRRIHSQLSSQAPSVTSQRKDIKPTQALGVRQEGGIERNEIFFGRRDPSYQWQPILPYAGCWFFNVERMEGV